MKTVVITGASTGIGRTTAERLAAKGWKVFAGVRKQEDADTLKKSDPAIEPLMLDVTKAEDIEAAIAKVSDTLGGAKLAGLVNNAGIASMGPLALQPAEEFKAHFEVNVFGTLSATQGFLPLLGMDRNRTGDPGRIVNITSLGGRIAAPFLGAYTATKHAVESMTDSFRRELIIYGIDAIAIGPGSVKTPIWDKAEDKNEDQPYAHSAWAEPIRKFSETMLKGGREGLPPERVAEIIETALTDSSPKARYAPVPDKFTNWTIPTHIPKRWLDSIFANRFGMEKPD